jgi:hypothetical protein
MSTAANRLWRFDPAFDRERQSKLVALKDFGEVIYLIRDAIQHIHVEPCRGKAIGLEHCIQPIFTLSLTPYAVDAFFNSPVGYRASYLASPNQGLLSNLALVEELRERLVQTAQDAYIAELSTVDLNASLLATSCKAWIHEDDFPFESVTRDLAVERWLTAAAAGEKKACWGLCAPQGARIQVKGALLDSLGHEVVPQRKVLRRYEIHDLGFS